MKVAVSAHGPTLDDKVDERFGRAAYLLVVDDETHVLDAIDNVANRNAMEGAGLGAAEVVSEHGATAVITGHLGPKAFRALGLVGIDGYNGTGLTVREAIEKFDSGQLARLGEGEAHAGMPQ